MALSLSKQTSWVNKDRGGTYEGVIEITFDDDYPTGGYALAASTLSAGASTVYWVSTGIIYGTNVGFATGYDYANSKLLVFESAGDGDPMDECADEFDGLDGLTCRIHYIVF